MADFSIVKIGARQYKVSKGDVLEVDKLKGIDTGKKIVFDEVLLSSKKDKITVGTPSIKAEKVEATFVEETKGKKVHSNIYKAKSRYRRSRGHRAQFSKIKITKI